MKTYKINNFLIYVFFLTLLIGGCANQPDSAMAPALDGDGFISKDASYSKEVFYGTTRVPKCNDRTFLTPDEASPTSDLACASDLTRLNSGNGRTNNKIKYGKVIVQIPFSKEIGGIEGMSITNIEHDIKFSDFISELTSEDLLVFIHGFNTSFTNAAIRTAQLAHDTNFKGEAVFFSWPSLENPATYGTDKKRAKENFKHLAQFLIKISENTNKKIHVIAHSMGTYLLVNSLAIISDKRNEDNELLRSRILVNNGKIFNQIILAAPDISQDDYHLTFNEYNLSNISDKITLYSSINDHVLSKASRLTNYFIEGTAQARLGDSSDGFFVVNGMDTIDTRQEILPQFFGHSFYANYRGLVTDIYLLLKYGTEPDERMLQRVIDGRNKKSLWFIRD
ncbi:alpha/beta hydrolase [Alteromonas ponticola]|uniref:Alpha/beta hydrolase n=1 Tax=Alteromonas aquimaris TaxID=2998417 RepID=A0ABT3P2Y6_9ALTE|nr:alpha/beta hydrolase [Alteromonas aquimaris]MCW8107135.1 alpha/beta hydrolase [Alteromonas aquimaris]